MKTQRLKKFVALGFALISTASAQAEDVKDWLADHPSAFVAAMGASVAGTTNAIGLHKLSKAKPIPYPVLAMASPAGPLNEAQQIYSHRSESYSREIIGTEEALKSREKQIVKLRAEYDQLDMPHDYKRHIEIPREINTLKKDIEILQSRIPQLRSKLELSIKKESEVGAYVKSGAQGHFLTQNDHVFLDQFKNRYSFAANEYERLTRLQAKKLAYRSEVKRSMLYGSLIGLVSVPVVGSMALVGTNGVNEERREKSANIQSQQGETNASVEAVNAKAN